MSAFMSQDELVERFLAQHAKHRGVSLLRKKADALFRQWSNVGLFGSVGNLPSTIGHEGRGKGKGRGKVTVYREAALERLAYALHGTTSGTGIDRIKRALELEINPLLLGLCDSDKNFRYVLTRPLVFLLNQKRPQSINASTAYRQMWAWKRASDALLEKLSTGEPDLDAEELFEKSSKARNLIPLGFYIEPLCADQTEAQRLYTKDLKKMEKDSLNGLVDAMRRVATASAKTGDLELIKKFSCDGYVIRVERDDQGHRPVFSLAVDAPRPLTLLEHAASHLLCVRKELRLWLRKCSCTDCHRFYCVYDTDRDLGRCNSTRCRDSRSAKRNGDVRERASKTRRKLAQQ